MASQDRRLFCYHHAWNTSLRRKMTPSVHEELVLRCLGLTSSWTSIHSAAIGDAPACIDGVDMHVWIGKSNHLEYP